jgi:RNA polymerase sigma-B factor
VIAVCSAEEIAAVAGAIWVGSSGPSARAEPACPSASAAAAPQARRERPQGRITLELPKHYFVDALARQLVEVFVEKAQNRSVDRPVDPVCDLVETHLPLVRALARRHARGGAPYEELVQVGAVGLVAAARRYDAARGDFAPYAAATVQGEMLRFLRDRSATVRVPRRVQEGVRVLRASDAGTPLPVAAAAAGLSLDEAERALGGAAAPLPLATLDDRASADAAEAIEACEERAFVEELLGALDARERAALTLRFRSDLPQREIARRLRLSQSQTSRVLAGALEKLRRSYEAA